METNDHVNSSWRELLKTFKLSESLSEALDERLEVKDDTNDFLTTLSALLFQKEYTDEVAKNFPSLLLELLTRGSKVKSPVTVFETLSRLIGLFPAATDFAYRLYGGKINRFLCHVSNQELRDSKKKTKRTKHSHETSLDSESILTACLSFLWFDPDFFRETFDWSHLYSHSKHDDLRIKWLSLQCLRVVSGISESDVYQHLLETSTETDVNNIRLEYNHLFQSRIPLVVDEHDSEKLMSSIDYSCLSPEVVCVQSILLPKYQCNDLSSDEPSVVLVESFRRSLQSLAQCIVSSQPVIIQGPVGSGKTTLVEYLASITGRNGSPALTKVQLGDQIDSKVLVGGHICTEIPGEFVWRPGPLTSAMINGHWLLFEDIDSAGSDVLTTITAALKSRSLSSLPGCNVSSAIDGNFRIFFTRRTNTTSSVTSVVHSELERMSTVVQTVYQSRQEMEEMIKELWPSIPPSVITNSILPTFDLISNPGDDNSTRSFSERSVSIRDLIKWCKRLSLYSSVKDIRAEDAFKDAVDCFIPNPVDNIEKTESLGAHLNICKPDAQRLALSDPHQPDHLRPKELKIGRVVLPVKKRDALSLRQEIKSSFAFTRSSKILIERIAAAVYSKEAVLLVGETGTGKTSTVQFLAKELGHDLVVVNLNQQSDSCDLIGGFKPVEIKLILEPVRNEFDLLVRRTFKGDNEKFLSSVKQCLQDKRYKDLLDLMKTVKSKADDYFKKHGDPDNIHDRWQQLDQRVNRLSAKCISEDKKSIMAFSFVEGSLVRAMKTGQWILLDEINLAENETLQSLSAVLDSNDKPVILPDKTDGIPVVKHPNFRIFACMNPATDVGKRDLPLGIRNRFTEFFVNELSDENDLRTMVNTYLPTLKPNAIVNFYMEARSQSMTCLSDTTGHRPHYSLRTLCRALSVAARNPCQDMKRSLYESFCMSFLTQLDSQSRTKVENLISKHILDKNAKAVISKPIPEPNENERYLEFEGFWLKQGPQEPVTDSSYILTNTIRKNLKDLVRILSIGSNFPVLLQGETSVGKTSLIQFLAKSTGNVCRRVNNHEHTDLEEYVGSYCSDENGNLVFKEGVLVEAMRMGDWIILDELNLAPTEVLEALNRVLDDNRELFIPETQETVKAHANFQLFATQNPPGVYGGRKLLSRAFRNRFVELHFDEIPKPELIVILEKRCLVPASFAKKMVDAMSDLELNRRGSDIFAGKSGFITLRDLFRWGDRYRVSKDEDTFDKFYEWDEYLATIGFMILAGRVRKQEEVLLIEKILEKRFLKKNQRLNPEKFIEDRFQKITGNRQGLLDPDNKHGFGHLTATANFKRLVVLLWDALRYREPVLLVGETGCGKTTACQVYAALHSLLLSTINCHMHSEGSDFLGSLRPVRDRSSEGKLFEWVDGPLVTAMLKGHMFLLDEISLADDSVLERLNSVLEPEKTLLLTERGGEVSDVSPVITAHPSFLMVATMNPGGDYGKKELSPALRNRFTEIWCPSTSSEQDLMQIILQNLRSDISLQTKKLIARVICDFLFWFRENVVVSKSDCSVRDILSWIEFINKTSNVEEKRTSFRCEEGILHGAQLVFIDSIGCGGFFASEDLSRASRKKVKCMKWLSDLVCKTFHYRRNSQDELSVSLNEDTFGIGLFSVDIIPGSSLENLSNFTFECQGVQRNCLKVLRAMQLSKPILLEGAPGVGKTSLVQALAQRTGRKVVRINLSEQTDISDLFGGDFPVEGDDELESTAGQFQWRDGPLLQALKSDDTWIILDELNLASQSVLEGLNACLDHRGEIFVSELGRVFKVNKENTRFFACQNPYGQGGARKGLPKSFLNRFTVVFVDAFTKEDLIEVTTKMFPILPTDLIEKLVSFNQILSQEIDSRKLALSGSPWELNLRDIFRFCSLLTSIQGENKDRFPKRTLLSNCVDFIYCHRLRTIQDRKIVADYFTQVFALEFDSTPASIFMSPEVIESTRGIVLKRQDFIGNWDNSLKLSPSEKSILISLMTCVHMNWMSILVSSTDSDTSSIVKSLAALSGRSLKTLSINSEMDAIELLGGFEKKDWMRRFKIIEDEVFAAVQEASIQFPDVLSSWYDYCQMKFNGHGNDDEEIEQFRNRVKSLCDLTKNLRADGSLQKLQSLLLQLSECMDLTGGGSFEWIDSPLVTALKQGHWLLLQDVNLCSASVLDRLNSLFEPNGSLILSEQGSVGSQGIPVIKPHDNFRIFMTMNCKAGELSRAMRNRGIEIFMIPNEGEFSLQEEVCSQDVKSIVGDCITFKVSSEYSLIKLSADGSSSESETVGHRVLLSRSSQVDHNIRRDIFFSRFAISREVFLSSEKCVKNLSLVPHHPVDDRLFSLVDDDRSSRINQWLYSLWCDFHPSHARVFSIPHPKLSDQELMHLRIMSQVYTDLPAKDPIIYLLMNKFERSLKVICQWIHQSNESKASRFFAWNQFVKELSSRVRLNLKNTGDLFYRWNQLDPSAPGFEETQMKLINCLDSLTLSEKSSEEFFNIKKLGSLVESQGRSRGNKDCHEERLLWHLWFHFIEDALMTSSRSISSLIEGVISKGLLEGRVTLHPLHMLYSSDDVTSPEVIAFHLINSSFIYQKFQTLLEEKSSILLSSLSSPADLLVVSSDILSKTRITLKSLQDKRDSIDRLGNLLFLASVTDGLDDFSSRRDRLLNVWKEKIRPTLDSELNTGMKWQSNHIDVPHTGLKKFVSTAVQYIAVGLSTARLFAPIHDVDPAQLAAAEVSHFKRVLVLTENEITFMERLSHLDSCSDKEHPHLKMLRESKDLLSKFIEEASNEMIPRTSSYDSLKSIAKNLEKRTFKTIPKILSTCHECFNSLTREKSRETCQEQIENLRKSLQDITQRLIREFVDFSDIMYPFVVGLLFLEQGLRGVHLALSSLKSMEENKHPADLVDSVVSCFGNFFNSDLLSSANFITNRRYHFNCLVQLTNSSCSNSNLPSKILLSSLVDLRNWKALSLHEQDRILELAKPVIALFVDSWKERKENDRRKKELDDALVHYKMSQDNVDEDKTDEEREVQEILRRFPSFRHEFQDLGTKYDMEDMSVQGTVVDRLTSVDEDVLALIRIHKDFVLSEKLQLDLWTPVRSNYSLMSFLLNQIREQFLTVKEVSLMPIQLFTALDINDQRDNLTEKSTKNDFNIYYDSCPVQTTKCHSVLSKFKQRVTSLLEEFPEHPTLERLLNIINRLFSFEVDSPLMKFLTGIELLWEESQEWNKNWAHKQIKLDEEISSLTELIISWRKNELSNWNNCLNSVAKKYEDNDLIQWWFYLYDLSSDVESQDSDKLIDSLKTFLEGSTVGVFSSRLEMLTNFCYQISDHMSPSFFIFNNISNFYSQFVPSVSSQHLVDRRPIEEDVKEIVKIMRWHDMNYWALKDSIHKSHKSLNRSMKKYEVVLRKSVAPLLTPTPGFETTVSEFKLDPRTFLVKDGLNSESITDLDFLPKDFASTLPVISKNMKKFSKRIMTCFLPVVDVINSLDQSRIEFASVSDELKDSKLNLQSSDGNERKKAVHYMHNRKRTSLTSVFKELSSSGLSWSTGMQVFHDFDVNKVFSTTASLQSSSSEQESCNSYFFSNLARFCQLQTAIVTPSKDLTPVMIDRIKGFSGHFMTLMISNHDALARVTHLLKEMTKSASGLYSDAIQTPSRSSQQIRLFVVLEKIHFILSHFSEQKSRSVPGFTSISFSFTAATNAVENARNLLLSSTSVETTTLETIIDSLLQVFPEKSPLREELMKIPAEEPENKGVSTAEENSPLVRVMSSDLITLCMKSIENLLKTVNITSVTEDTRFLDVLSLLQSLLKIEEVDKICRSLSDLISQQKGSATDSACASVIKPFIMQYLELVRFFVTLATAAQAVFGKQIQVLLDLFIHLTQKGFCLPPEVLQEEKHGETNDLSGIGLDEGEGVEDISSKITNEDQLEDAKQEGQQKLEDDKDCNKEEKGLEMDGDFDGKNYDMEREEGEENEDNEQDSQNEMGNDVDEVESSYDKKLWEEESDEEEEEQDEDMDDAEDDGKGERFGEDKIVAAEGVKEDEDEKKDPGRDGDQTKDINENEMDDEYEGEKEDPVKSKENLSEKLPEENEFDLPNDLDLDDEVAHEGEEDHDSMTDVENESDSLPGEDTHETDHEEDAEEMEAEDDQNVSEAVDPVDEEPSDASTEKESDAVSSLNKSDRPEAIPSDKSKKNDNVIGNENIADEENNMDESGESQENQGVGDSQLGRDKQGHQTIHSNNVNSSEEGRSRPTKPSQLTQGKETRKSFASDSDRPVKKQKILPNVSHEDQIEETVDEESNINSKDYQHVRDEDNADEEVMDSGIDKQRISFATEKTEGEEMDESKDDFPEEEEEESELKEVQTKEAEKFDKNRQGKSKEKKLASTLDQEESDEEETEVGEAVRTSLVERGPSSLFASKPELLTKTGNMDWTKFLSQVVKYNVDSDENSLAAASLLWDECCRRVSPLVFELCQQLQLVLEPSKCSKLKGDYRTGKRINMRKVIAYIASQFRKDKIWLRRSKPSKRAYQIIIAVDDSQSMMDNESKMMAFESLALLSKSLSLVEAGQLAVMSFGEDAKLLHSLDEPFSDATGSRLLSGFSFDQKKTRIDSLLQSVSSVFLQNKSSSQSTRELSQLLIILSDGRGIFNENRDLVTQRIRGLNDAGIFCVFVILDTGKASIFDIRSAQFDGGKCQIESYMDTFPFPFYVVLRDVNNIPVILGESLRQWFELITQHK